MFINIILNLSYILYIQLIYLIYKFIKVLSPYLRKKEFRFGKGYVCRYTLIEIRWLFSIYFHNIQTYRQDRFHTHAFSSISFIVNGGYSEEVKGDNKIYNYDCGKIRYIPQLMNHRLLYSNPDTWSIILCGPYSKIWTEELDNGTVKVISSHQNILYTLKNDI